MQKRDATIVLGNGIREGGELPSWVRRHLDRAVELYEGEYLIPASAGTTHRPPPRDEHGFPIFESAAAAKYLIGRGIPAERILTEASSYDTVGNAYFTRVQHAEPAGLRRLLVIASEFHASRAEQVFRWVYGLEPLAAAFELSFEAVGDPEMDAGILDERLERERERLEQTRALAERITTLGEFHRWFFTEHDAYNALRRAFSESRLSGAILESY